MNKAYRYNWQLISFIFLLTFILLYPFYQYVFDVDGVGYLSVAKHYANGEWQYAINGYWSPLHSWLIAPFIKLGANEFMAFKISNAVFSIGIIFFLSKLLKKLSFSDQTSFFTLLISALLLLYFAFSELAADLLQCFLLVLYFDTILSKKFFFSLRKNLLCGVVAAIAYFAKSYTLPFFIIHFLFVQIIFFRNNDDGNKLRFLFRNLLAAYSSLLLLAFPWIMLLHDKYGIWTISTAGNLNQSWYLIPGIHNDSVFFLAPPHINSPGFWEDPFFAQGKFYTPFTSYNAFIRELKVILHNLKETFFIGIRISFLTPLIFSWLLLVLRKQSVKWKLILLTFVTLPLGYLLIHIENRFIWLLNFLFIICGIGLIEWWAKEYKPKKIFKRIAVVLLFASFMIHPLIGLKNIYNQDKNIFAFASIIKNQNIYGNISSNDPGAMMEKVAYLTNNSFYRLAKLSFNYDDLLTNMRKDNIKYFFFFYKNETELNEFRNNSLYNDYAESDFNFPQVILLKLK